MKVIYEGQEKTIIALQREIKEGECIINAEECYDRIEEKSQV